MNRISVWIEYFVEIKPERKKTEFFIMSSEHSFDEIFNPDRDPVHFRTLVDKLMPPNPFIPQELRVEKAKELIRKKGEELKPHFCFQDWDGYILYFVTINRLYMVGEFLFLAFDFSRITYVNK